MPERSGALLEWYRKEARDLPWRRTGDPWAILVSEVMLQQTPVTRVLPAYRRFVSRFPGPASAASADLGELITIWGTLGYQRRVVNLHRAAVMIEANGWPSTAAGLRALPGVGPYTAAAVACFAFGEPVAAVDTNLRRVLSRWVGRPLDGADLQQVADELLDREHPSEWNQAIMDLGAQLCRPRRPLCAGCPVAAWCSDPAIESLPRRQSPYAGSVRQARAAILSVLASGGSAVRGSLAGLVGLEAATVDEALTALAAEGLVADRGDRIQLGGPETGAVTPPGSWPAWPSPEQS